jgi:hypothetical protein
MKAKKMSNQEKIQLVKAFEKQIRKGASHG